MFGTDSALDALYWRAEILQALYWMRGEGLASQLDAPQLADFLLVPHAVLEPRLRQLVTDGYLTGDGARYALTPMGVIEGGRSFQDEFGDLTRPAHYECGPGCWCQDPDHSGEPCPGHPVPGPSLSDAQPVEPADE